MEILDALREAVAELGKKSASMAAKAHGEFRPLDAAAYDGEVLRTLEILAIIDEARHRTPCPRADPPGGRHTAARALRPRG